jgi:predicted GH43/DUF377 family glycosyl hydrolase
MVPRFKRHAGNPIVIPGLYAWRRVAVFNPAVIFEDGGFYMFERACSSLDPLKCQVGLLRSDDGFRFRHVCERPVVAPEQFDAPQGTIEDPRVVKIEGRFHMTFVFRRWAATCRPNGIGVARYAEHPDVPQGTLNNYQSGIAVSDDMLRWESLGLITPPEIHDRDNVLFPDKIGGRYVMLRRPNDYIGPKYGCARPSIWISFSEDLKRWTEPVLVATPRQEWEAAKIGAASPPIRTDAGWLTLYHGVDQRSAYRVGVMLLDLAHPEKVLARSPEYLMGSEAYYEKVGLIIPNVIFPTANVVKEGVLYLYYGCCDTCISAATVSVGELLDYVRRFPVR